MRTSDIPWRGAGHGRESVGVLAGLHEGIPHLRIVARVGGLGVRSWDAWGGPALPRTCKLTDAFGSNEMTNLAGCRLATTADEATTLAGPAKPERTLPATREGRGVT